MHGGFEDADEQYVSGGQREKEADRRVEAVHPGYCPIEKSHAPGPGAVRIVAEEVVVAGGHVVLGVVCREVVGVAVIMADDVVDQLADIPLRARCRPTQPSSVMAVSLRSNSALAIASASMIQIGRASCRERVSSPV